MCFKSSCLMKGDRNRQDIVGSQHEMSYSGQHFIRVGQRPQIPGERGCHVSLVVPYAIFHHSKWENDQASTWPPVDLWKRPLNELILSFKPFLYTIQIVEIKVTVSDMVRDKLPVRCYDSHGYPFNSVCVNSHMCEATETGG